MVDFKDEVDEIEDTFNPVDDGKDDKEKTKELREWMLRNDQGQNVEESSSCLAHIFYGFVNPMIKYGYKQPLTPNDIFPIASCDQVSSVKTGLTTKWMEELSAKGRDAASYWSACYQFVKWRMFGVVLLSFFQRAGEVLPPLVLEKILLWMESDRGDEEGYILAAILFGIVLVSALAHDRLMYLQSRAFVNLRSGVSAMVYDKALRVDPTFQLEHDKKPEEKEEKKTDEENDGQKQEIEMAVQGKPADEGDVVIHVDNDDEKEEKAEGKKGAKAKGKQKDSDISTGHIVNLMSSDAEKLSGLTFQIQSIIVLPIQIGVIIWLIYDTIGNAMFAGLAAMIFALPASAVVMYKTLVYTRGLAIAADARIKVMNEILQGIRVVKFYAWERPFMGRVEMIREGELGQILNLNLTLQFMTLLFTILPVLIAVFSFLTYVELGNDLTPSIVFRALGLFNALQFPFIMLPSSVSQLMVALVSARRIQNFLNQPDMRTDQIQKIEATTPAASDGDEKENSQVYAMESHGSFTFNPTIPPTLKELDFKAQSGKLTAIIGPVGSGKSALLASLLGEMQPVGSGTYVKQAGTKAYVAQRAWIQNLTVRDNILFGLEYDRKRYRRTVKAADLIPDFAIMPNSDQTEIGDRGINLSGGQKQRVAIARAVYADADVVLFDDPLSAVDANVGEKLFKGCLSSEGMLSEKTRILVTNQLHLLPRCDYIYIMEEGRIIQHGTFENIDVEGSPFRKLMDTYRSNLTAEMHEIGGVDVDLQGGRLPLPDMLSRQTSVESKVSSRGRGNSVSQSQSIYTRTSRAASVGAQERGKTLEDEEIESDPVSFRSYLTHFSRMGWPIFIMMCIFGVLGQAISSGSVIFLAFWSEDKYDKTNGWYLSGYVIFGVAAALVLLAKGVVFAYGSRDASMRYHEDLFGKIIRARASFYDKTPLGRILNRFSKDIHDIDGQLPRLMQNAFALLLLAMGGLVATMFITPLFAFVVAGMIVLFGFLQQYYSRTAIQLKRIENVNRSPIFNHFSETLNGLTTIRSFGVQDRFKDTNAERIDTNCQAMYLNRMVFRWANIRVKIMQSLLTFSCCAFVIMERDDLEASLGGAAISFVLSNGVYIGFLMMMLTELDNMMNAVERVENYINEIEVEGSWDHDRIQVPEDWPQHGVVDLEHVVMTYREDLPPAVKDVSAAIRSQEKIGIAGRTGSGKSSLMLAMLRMYELQSGRIQIDGVDIAEIGLHTLRKNVAIIPQDPVVFSGTIRSNLDPFEEFDEKDLNWALDQTDLARAVEQMPGKLDAKVTEYGGNLSVGQRQLLCIARAVLRKPKILLMDEATSSVDLETDAFVQKTIREVFKEATVLTIAHRLNTIMDSSRVLVLPGQNDVGKKLEFDIPAELLKKENGIFSAMHKAMSAHHKA